MNYIPQCEALETRLAAAIVEAVNLADTNHEYTGSGANVELGHDRNVDTAHTASAGNGPGSSISSEHHFAQPLDIKDIYWKAGAGGNTTGNTDRLVTLLLTYEFMSTSERTWKRVPGSAAPSFGPANGDHAPSVSADEFLANVNLVGVTDVRVRTHSQAFANDGGSAGSHSVIFEIQAFANINSIPVASADAYSTNEDTMLAVPVPGVLGNDMDADGDALTAVLANGTLNGSVDFNADGSFRYVPSGNFNGTDSFTYTAFDGRVHSQPTTVTITVTAINDAPVNLVPGRQRTPRNRPLIFSPARGNAISVSDVDAGTARVQVFLRATNGLLSLRRTTGLTFSAGDGTNDVVMRFTGTIAAVNAALNGMRFRPNPGFVGIARVRIVVNDRGNTGAGGPIRDIDSIVVVVRPSPAFSGPRSALFANLRTAIQLRHAVK